MNKKRTLYQILTTDFRVSIRNHENFALKRDFRINYAQIIVILAGLIFLISVFDFYIFSVVNNHLTYQIEKNSIVKSQQINLLVDTLRLEIARRDSFIKQIQQVIVGNN